MHRTSKMASSSKATSNNKAVSPSRIHISTRHGSVTLLLILIVSVSCSNSNNNNDDDNHINLDGYLSQNSHSQKSNSNPNVAAKNLLSHKNDVLSTNSNSNNNKFLAGASASGPSGRLTSGAASNNNRVSNELNAVPFNEVGGGIAGEDDEGYIDELDSDDEGDYSYEDEAPPGAGGQDNWGSDFQENDIKDIEETEKKHGKPNKGHPAPKQRPQMAKCCNVGEGLNAQGVCKPHHHHHNHGGHKSEQQHGSPRRSGPIDHTMTNWFPSKIFNIDKGNWTTIQNISEWDIKISHYISCPENESSELISDANKFAITNYGRLFVLHRENKEVEELNFCVDLLLNEGKPAVRSCFTKTELCGSSLKCLRKCCPEDALVLESNGECIYSEPHRHLSKFPTDKWNVIHGSPTCKFGQYFKEVTGQFTIDSDASFISPNVNTTFDNYCLDYFLETSKYHAMTHNSPNSLDSDNTDSKDDKKKTTSTLAPIRMPVLKVVTCFNDFEDRLENAGIIILDRPVTIIYGVTLIISAICILMAGIISWRLPELHSLHGKCQLCHLATLFCLFLLLAIVHLHSEGLASELCTAFAVLIHILALSAFLWLNLLCVNIYLTFRSLRPPLAARRGENRRLLFLCIYAWGIPTAFCVFLYLLEKFEPGRLSPMPAAEYGLLICLISNRKAQFAYLFGPVGVLLLVNGILFCLTTKELLCGLWRLENSDSINFRRKSMGIVVGKLGVVMGMGWILDVLSWGFGGPDFPYMFYVSDLFNALQGVFIFLVLIWRKRVLEMLHLRKPALIKDETLTARPFLQKSSLSKTQTNGGGGGGGSERSDRIRPAAAATGNNGVHGEDADTSLALIGPEQA